MEGSIGQEIAGIAADFWEALGHVFWYFLAGVLIVQLVPLVRKRKAKSRDVTS